MVVTAMTRTQTCGAIGILFGALVACSKKTPEPTPQKSAPVVAKGAGEVDPSGKLMDPNDPKHGTRKLMGLDVPVYVDGAQIAVFRFGEMPAMNAIVLEGGAKRYRIYDYLKGIGVAPESIKSVHLHGNSDRIASLEGSELLNEKDRFQFQFISGNTGTPLQKWDTDGLKNEFVIHEIRRVTVYVKKPTPPIHKDRQCHVGADGDCTDAIPYVNGELAKGTRIYVDGKMVGFVKRRLITDAMGVGDTADGQHKFSVSKFVSSLGVDSNGINAVELVAGDDVVGRANANQWTSIGPQIYFTLPAHNHGKVRVHVPGDFQARDVNVQDRDALVSSVLVYKSTTPADRALRTISEDTDIAVQVAAIDDARAQTGRGEH